MEPISIRWVTVERVLEILRDLPALSGVQIEPGWPGDTIQSEAIWVDELDGQIDVPVSKNGFVARDDVFKIPLEIRVVKKSYMDAMRRTAEIIATIEYHVASDVQLGQLDGVVSARITGERQTAGQVKGAGVIAFGEVEITVHAASR